MTLFELCAFCSVVSGAITGAVTGARHGFLGIVLGGAGGLVIGFGSYMGAVSPMGLVALMSPEKTHGLRARLVNLLAGCGFFILIPFAPIGAGIATWWLVRLISG